MKRTTAPWTIAIATATILAMPLSGLAQTSSQTPPPAQPPTTTQQEQPTPPPQGDATKDAAKIHLTAARNTLSQITQLPAAAQLQGEQRAQVSQLITNFNELITTKTEWKTSFTKVESNVDALLGGAAPAAEPGKPPAQPAAGELDPAIRTKLVEFREHLTKFEQAASAAPPEPAAATPAQTPPTTPPPDTPPQTPPATPPTNQTPPTTPPNQPEPTQPPQQQDDKGLGDPEELLRHIEAIEAIIGAQAAAQAAQPTNPVGTTGTASGSTRTTVTGRDVMLTPEQVQQLRTHLAELRRLVGK